MMAGSPHGPAPGKRAARPGRLAVVFRLKQQLCATGRSLSIRFGTRPALRSGSVRGERPKLLGARPQDGKDNDMFAAPAVAWPAADGLVLIARADYGRRPLTR